MATVRRVRTSPGSLGWVLVLLGAAACGPPRAGTPPPRLSVEVVVRPGEPVVASVTAVAHPAVLAELAPPADAEPWVKLLGVERGPAPDAPPEAGALEVLSYVLELHRPPADAVATALRTRPTARGWVLRGASLLPTGPADLPTGLHFALPPDWRLRTTVQPLPLDARGPIMGPLDDVREGLYAVGALVAIQVVAGGLVAELASGDFELEHLARLTQVVERSSTGLAELLGSSPALWRAIWVDLGQTSDDRDPGPTIDHVPGGSALLTTAPPSGDPLAPLERAAVEALAVAWLAGAPSIFAEGLRGYLGDLVAARTAGLSETEAVAYLLRRCSDRRCSGPLPRAVLAAACVDLELRRWHRSLPSLVRPQGRGSPAVLTADAFLARIGREVPDAADAVTSLVARWLGGEGEGEGEGANAAPSVACLQRAGYAVDFSTARPQVEGAATPGLSPFRD